MRLYHLLPVLFLAVALYGCETIQSAMAPQKSSSGLKAEGVIEITFNVISPRIKNLKNVSIYLLNPDVLNRCRCEICFTTSDAGGTPPEDCDDQVLSDLKNTGGRLVTTPGSAVQITPGVAYQILITEKFNNIERPVWSKQIIFNQKDAQPYTLQF